MIKECGKVIRFANEQDAAEIAKLHISNIRRTYKGIYIKRYFETLSEDVYRESWKVYLNRRDCRTVVYIKNGEIVGFLGFCLFNMPNKNAILDYFHVSEKMEKQGIDSQLFDVLIGILVSEGIKELEILYVEGNDYARKYYEKRGAKYVGSFIAKDGGRTLFNNRMIVKKKDCPVAKNAILKLDLKEEYKRLQQYVKGEYALWGIGAYYNVFFEKFTDIHKPKYIFDNNKDYQGLKANGVQVVAPQKTDIPIIITCSKYQEVEMQLKELGCENYVAFYPWHDYSSI